MNDTDLVQAYQDLADVTQQALVATQACDWASYCALQAMEDALVTSLRNHGNLLQRPAVLAGLIHQILDCQKQTATLILVWRTELACEIKNTVGSRLLAQKYQDYS